MQEDLKHELPFLNLLRQVFLFEPSVELLRGIGKIEFPVEKGSLSGLERMIGSIRKHESRIEKWREDLAVEFARLFIGPVHPPAVPFASFYLSENQSLMTGETLDVRRRYLEAGLALKDLYRIPDDHIGMELDFLSYLSSKFLESKESGQDSEAKRLLKIRHDFLVDHFVLWAPLFANRIIESAQEEFYIGAASLLLELLDYYRGSPA